jgi:2-polyprenyl-3-methyl-5-hydroxy-6-metoxy-1,4-benzoquinol methylase
MDDHLHLQEKKKYERMWQERAYRINSPGFDLVDPFFSHFSSRIKEGQSITDFGCGMGLTAVPFLEKGLFVQLVDITKTSLQETIEVLLLLQRETLQFFEASLWNLPKEVKKTEWIYSVDVLEHIPEEKIPSVLSSLASRCSLGGLIQVFLTDDDLGELIEEDLHLTVKPLSWWEKEISKYWPIEKIEPIIPDIRISFYLGPPLQG